MDKPASNGTPARRTGKNRAVFLDRDGTLNVDHGYVHRFDDWEWTPGAIAALTRLKAAGYLLIVVTNQSGIARNYYSVGDMEALHNRVNEILTGAGAAIDAFYFCPHHPDFSTECDCRKPLPGMLLTAAREWSIDTASSWMVGDSERDVEAGLAAGCRAILLTGERKNSMPFSARTLDDAADIILDNDDKTEP